MDNRLENAQQNVLAEKEGNPTPGWACRSRAVIAVLRACESAALVYWGATNQWQTHRSPGYHTKIVKEMEGMIQERLRELGLSSLITRRFKVCGGCMTAALSSLRRGCREDGARIHTDTARGIRQVSTGKILITCFHHESGWTLGPVRLENLNVWDIQNSTSSWATWSVWDSSEQEWTRFSFNQYHPVIPCRSIITAGCWLPACLTQEREPRGEWGYEMSSQPF